MPDLPGSVSIPLRPAFATWIGWLVAADAPIVVVRTPDGNGSDTARPKARTPRAGKATPPIVGLSRSRVGRPRSTPSSVAWVWSTKNIR